MAHLRFTIVLLKWFTILKTASKYYIVETYDEKHNVNNEMIEGEDYSGKHSVKEFFELPGHGSGTGTGTSFWNFQGLGTIRRGPCVDENGGNNLIDVDKIDLEDLNSYNCLIKALKKYNGAAHAAEIKNDPDTDKLKCFIHKNPVLAQAIACDDRSEHCCYVFDNENLPGGEQFAGECHDSNGIKHGGADDDRIDITDKEECWAACKMVNRANGCSFYSGETTSYCVPEYEEVGGGDPHAINPHDIPPWSCFKLTRKKDDSEHTIADVDWSG